MRIYVDDKQWQIKFYYDEIEKELHTGHQTVTQKRRRTACEIILDEGNITLRGETICHPNDQYAKVPARREALKRALAGLDQPTRAKVWEGYFQAVLRDRKRGIMRRWGLTEDDNIDLVGYGIYDAATGGVR